jgi:HAD superfamily hydrolase (TIGR01509 family)
MLKLALYDADGVLIHTELATYELERLHGIPRAVSKEFFDKEWDTILLGKADTKEKLTPYLKKWGWKGSVEDYQKFWFEFEHKIDQKIISHIQQIRKRGIICAVATNQDMYRATYMIEKMGFNDSFDALYASAHLGEVKPNQQFFKAIQQKYNIKFNEIVFWDDSGTNVSAARSLGIMAEVYKDFVSYKLKMEELLKE